MYEIQSNEALGKAPVKKLFLQYALPSSAGMVILAAHIFIDGIFVGRGIGSHGLAAVNIVLPVFSLIIAFGLLLGIGGATVFSIKHGEKKYREANKCFTQSLVLMIITSVLITVLGAVYLDEIAYLLGSDKDLLPYVKDYMRILLWFSLFIIVVDGLSDFVRNDGGPNCAMIATIIGALANCTLNYIFIFIMEWGLKGAALGTGLAQIVMLAFLSSHFISRRSNLRLCRCSLKINDITRIIKNGLTYFAVEISLGLVVMVFNMVLMDMAGEKGVAAYSVMLYMSALIVMIFMGIGQGIQPIISYNYGALQFERVNKIYRLSNVVTTIIGVLAFMMALLAGEHLVTLFVPGDKQLLELVVDGIGIYFIAFLIMGFNFCSIAYFQAVEKVVQAVVLSLLRGCVLVIAGLLIFPRVIGISGVWLSVPVAELMALTVALFMLKRP